jgi:hypothetical protein
MRGEGGLCTSFKENQSCYKSKFSQLQDFQNIWFLLSPKFIVSVSFSQLHISSSCVRIRLHTENQRPRLPASTLFCWGCCDCCDGVKTMSTPSLLTKDWGWSWRIK